jgi:hypothetical protein
MVQFNSENYNKHGSKDYAYLTDLEFKTGDFAVVDTKSADSFGYHIVRITQVQGLLENQRLSGDKWIVQKVDVADYLLRMEKQKIAQEIRNKLKERREAMEEVAIYKMLAKDDPEINKLLHELANFDDTAKLLLPPEEIDKKINKK